MAEPSLDATHAPPPEAWEPALRLARIAGRPLDRFLRLEAASGILLIAIAVVALVWANSAWAESYNHLWHIEVGLRFGEFAFARPLHWWVNDGLMTIFFFVVGLEIRREIHHGELSEWRRAALPTAAAIGGMIAPALIYISLSPAGEAARGWGVPMGTDIAFAVGILTLLGRRVPAALRVLLLTLAVIDDLGAIMIIAVFYSSGISLLGIAVLVAGLLLILALQRFGVRQKTAYFVPALLTWAGAYAAGVHPTIAGVIVGMMTPVRAWLGTSGFLEHIQSDLNSLETFAKRDNLDTHAMASVLERIRAARREVLSPAEGLIEVLHPWVAFGIMPVFALANAGVAVGGFEPQGTPLLVMIGTALGLVLGKPIGILLASGIVLRSGLATAPRGIGRAQLVVLGLVAGIGFTMALFIAQLAFTSEALLSAAKIGVLIASAVAAVLGLAAGRIFLTAPPSDAAQSADEAESKSEV